MAAAQHLRGRPAGPRHGAAPRRGLGGRAAGRSREPGRGGGDDGACWSTRTALALVRCWTGWRRAAAARRAGRAGAVRRRRLTERRDLELSRARHRAAARPGRRRADRVRGVAAELAPAASLLQRLRDRERRSREAGLLRALPGLRRRAPSAHRPGRDHARGRRGARPRAARPPAELAAGPLLRAGGVRRAGRDRSRTRSRARSLEESGVEVAGARYDSSQPWPFPSSLMLGFEAVVRAPARPVATDGELEDARWFTRAELRGGRRGPRRACCCRRRSRSRARLIDGWLAARDDRRGGAARVVPGAAGRDRGDAVRAASRPCSRSRARCSRSARSTRDAARDLAEVRARAGGGAAPRPPGRSARATTSTSATGTPCSATARCRTR